MAESSDVFQVIRLIGVVLTFGTIVLFLRILVHQHGYLNKNTLTHRLVVLNVRTVLLLPIFSICYLIALEFDRLYIYVLLPASIAQGYATFSFVALFVHYAGGPEKCLEIFKVSRAYSPSCSFKNYLNSHPRYFYNLIYFTQIQFLILRPAVIIGEIVAEVQGRVDISNILSGVSAFLIIISIFGLVQLHHVLYTHVKGLNAKTKMIIIKGSIGMIVLEGLVEQVLAAMNVIGLESIGPVVRIYCFGVLTELFIVALVLERVYAKEIKTDKAANSEFAPHIVINGPDDGVQEIAFFDFVRAVCFFRDLFPPLNFSQHLLRGALAENDLNTPLSISETPTSRPLVGWNIQLVAGGVGNAEGMSNLAQRDSSNNNFALTMPSFDAKPSEVVYNSAFANTTSFAGVHGGSQNRNSALYYNSRASADIL